jgi:hypothetical protein
VTLLTLLPLEDEDEDALVVCGLVVDVVVVVAPALDVVDAGLDAAAVVDACLASAGSLPETSTIVIRSQLATNSASAPPMIRRRIVRIRASRADLSAWPRARAAPGWLLSVMVENLVVGVRASKRRDQLRVGPYQPRERRLRDL